MIGKLSTERINEFIESQAIGRIGCHGKGKTYVVPITYVAEKNNIYCHAVEGLKLQIMRENPDVCFEVDAIQDLGNWTSVIGWGRFEELTGEERARAIELLLNRKFPLLPSHTQKLSEYWPYNQDIEEIKGIVFRIRIDESTGRFEDNSSSPPFVG